MAEMGCQSRSNDDDIILRYVERPHGYLAGRGGSPPSCVQAPPRLALELRTTLSSRRRPTTRTPKQRAAGITWTPRRDHVHPRGCRRSDSRRTCQPAALPHAQNTGRPIVRLRVRANRHEGQVRVHARQGSGEDQSEHRRRAAAGVLDPGHRPLAGDGRDRRDGPRRRAGQSSFAGASHRACRI